MLTAIADQDPEVDLSSAEKSKLFEKVFDVKLKFAWEPPASAVAAQP